MRDRLLQAIILTLLLQMLAAISSSTSIPTKSVTRSSANQTSISTIIQPLFNLSKAIRTQNQKAEASFHLPR